MTQQQEIDLSDLRSWIGKEIPGGQNLEPIDRTEIRRWSYSVAEFNPLYWADEHAKNTPWNGQIAPPSFFYYLDYTAGALSVGKVPGTHVIYGGTEWEWFGVLRPGDVISIGRKFHDVQTHQGRFASTLIMCFGEFTYTNQKGELLARAIGEVVRYKVQDVQERRKYLDRGTYNYTTEELMAIERDKERYERRGRIPRYFEDVQVGDEIGPLVIGPHTVWDFARHESAGHRLPINPAESDAQRRRQYNMEIGYLPEMADKLDKGHVLSDFALTIGFPQGYDYGPQRMSWLIRLMSDWMGDHGFLKKLGGTLRIPNVIGDTTWLRGRVVDKEVQEGKHLIDCQIWADNQRGETIARGSATVVLPSQSGSLAF